MSERRRACPCVRLKFSVKYAGVRHTFMCRCRCNCRKHAAKRKCRPRTRRGKSKNRKRAVKRILYTVKRINMVRPDRSPISIRPVVKRYFFEAPHDIHLTGENLVLYPHQFADDTGEQADRFTDFGQEGYFNLYVNGVLQEGKLFHANSDALSIVATGQSIIKGTPIILESVGFHVARNSAK